MDYDDFGIYSNKEDIESYIESVFREGIEDKDEIYNMCIEKFGSVYVGIINELFEDEDEIELD